MGKNEKKSSKKNCESCILYKENHIFISLPFENFFVVPLKIFLKIYIDRIVYIERKKIKPAIEIPTFSRRDHSNSIILCA